MANNLTFTEGNLNIKNITEYPNSFKRQGAFPLERFSVFGTYDAAVDYAKNNAVAYVGQEIVVADGTTTRVFIIKNAVGDLAELGMTTSTGDLQIDLNNFKQDVENKLKTVNDTITDIQGKITTINTKLEDIEEGAQVNVIESIKLADDTTGEVTVGATKDVTISIDKVASATNADTATVAETANKTKGKLKISETKTFDGSNTEDMTITLSDLGYDSKETALKALINEKSKCYNFDEVAIDGSFPTYTEDSVPKYRQGDLIFSDVLQKLYVCSKSEPTTPEGTNYHYEWLVIDDVIDDLSDSMSDEWLKTHSLSAYQGKVLKGLIDTLNGDSTVEGSVDSKVATAVAKIVADAPEAYDTLKEIADWIAEHPEDTTAMNTAIQANTKSIEALTKLVGTLPEGSSFADVMAYIASKADKATTLAGYGITDAYTKNEVKEQINSNSNKIYIDKNYPQAGGKDDYRLGDAILNTSLETLSILSKIQATTYPEEEATEFAYTWTTINRVIDNLESIDSQASLSANQGKVLKDLVDTKANDADLATVAKTGKIDDLTQTKTIVFVAGNAASIS